MRRIMILGCGGMLGDAVYNHFVITDVVDATDIVLSSPWVHYQDVRDFKNLMERAAYFEPTVIINLAAITDMERCELDPEEAVMTNTRGSLNCCLLAKKFNIPYVYISTAGIFDGEKEYYSDDDQPNPLSVYSRTKYLGELVATKYEKHYVIRCGWSMGGYEKDKKFIHLIFDQIKNGAKELNVVDDKAGTPTYTVDFANGIDALLKSGKYGVYNQVCKGSCTRFDVAEEFVRLLGVDVKVNRVDSSFWQQRFFAPRPKSEKLLTNKLNHLGLNAMRDWKKCLAEYAEGWKCRLPMK